MGAGPSEEASRRAEIEAVFEAALELPHDRRGGWLAARCGADENLRAEVEALLGALDRPDRLLDGTSAPFVALAGSLFPEIGGQRNLGPYRILREIGRGGMGVVYLAERNDGQYQHRVAIKLLAASPEAAELRRRFLAERQILATLSHPNIAQLLDGGFSQNRVPYLVIEYIDGSPITTYCQREGLDVEARLRLFREVCSAIHHAHRHLVLHLDVKPGNILVTRDGQVKLLDFGIAKLLGPRPSQSDEPLTVTEARPMTPGYASPEQIRGEPLSTASDVYALGLVLYELLTGVRAYDVGSSAPHEAFAVITEREPARPSNRDTPFARQLRGDLDAIVMMALRKEPSRRYGSADLLSADIGRYLDGRPVLAHRGSTWYRFGKLVRRHRVAVAATVLAVAALGGGTSAALWQARVAERARGEAATALAQSKEVTNFLLGIFAPNDPSEGRQDSLTIKDLLGRGAARAEELGSNPLVQAGMFEALSRAHLSIGDLARSLDFSTRALALRDSLLGGRDSLVAATAARVADVRRLLGDYRGADSLASRALEARRAAFGDLHPDVVESLRQLSGIAVYLNDLPRAERLIEEGLTIRRRVGSDSLLVSDLEYYGSVLARRGRTDEAVRAMREAETLARRVFRSPHVDHANSEMRLAELLGQLPGGRQEADTLARAAVAEITAARGENNPMTAETLRQAAMVIGAEGGAETENMLRRALDLERRLLDPRAPDLAFTLSVLGYQLAATGRLPEAEAILREAVLIMGNHFGRRHSTYAGALGGLADLLILRGALDSAEALHHEAVDIRAATFGPNSDLVALTSLGLARVSAARGKIAAADSIYRSARAILLRQTTEANPDVQRIDEALALLGRSGSVVDVRRLMVPPH